MLGKRATHLNCIFKFLIRLSLLGLLHTAWREVLGREILLRRRGVAALAPKAEATSLEPALRFPKTSIPAPEEMAQLQEEGSHGKEALFDLAGTGRWDPDQGGPVVASAQGLRAWTLEPQGRLNPGNTTLQQPLCLSLLLYRGEQNLILRNSLCLVGLISTKCLEQQSNYSVKHRVAIIIITIITTKLFRGMRPREK